MMTWKIDQAEVQELSKLGSRGAFGRGLMLAAEEDDNLLVLSADLAGTSRVQQFADKYPDRFFNAGIAEQNMTTVASALAQEGNTVFCTSFAIFSALRACEQVRTDVAYMNANVKIVGADAGVTIGTQGYTHYAVEDISVLRAIPNLTILCPADGVETAKATIAAARHRGPVYLRLTGKGGFAPVYQEDYPFTIGKAVRLREGDTVAILAAGTIVHEALQAAEMLAEQGIQAEVADFHTIKPLDTAYLHELVGRVKLIVTAEEHSVLGGLGGAVCEEVAALGAGVPVLRCGLPDSFASIADYRDQLQRFGLTAGLLAERIRQALEK